ncbi:MAG: extracellular solute-binding protein [Deltaproteobacteria bacterium]|nr:extracellular solute-binding protein [Deltaproteobacteria bacterium]
MRKLIFCLLAFIFILTSVNCKKPEDAKRETPAKQEVKEKTKLVLWHSYRGGEKEALDKIIRNFNESEKDIMVESLPIPYDAFADKITAAIPRGHGPDVFIFAHDRLGDWAISKVVEPLDLFVQEDPSVADNFPAAHIKSLSYKGSLYGLPMAFKSTALFYNKKLVTKVPETMDELISIAKKITNPKNETYGLVYEAGNFYFHSAIFHAFGAKVFDENYRPSFTSKESVDSFKFLSTLLKQKIMPEEITSTLVTSLFNQNKAAFVINGPWFLGEIDKSVEFGVAPLPIMDKKSAPSIKEEKRLTPFLTVEAIIMSAKSNNKKEAFRLMKYITSDTQAEIRLREGSQTVSNSRLYEKEEINSNPVIMAFFEQQKHTIPMENTPEMRMVWTPVQMALSKFVRGETDYKGILESANKEITNYIERK